MHLDVAVRETEAGAELGRVMAGGLELAVQGNAEAPCHLEQLFPVANVGALLSEVAKHLLDLRVARAGIGGWFEGRPTQRCHVERGQPAGVGVADRRRDATFGERLHHGDPIVVLVIGDVLRVGGDQRPEEVEERHVDRREVIQGADAHLQHLPGNLRGLGREPVGEVGVDGTVGELPGAPGSQPEQVDGS